MNEATKRKILWALIVLSCAPLLVLIAFPSDISLKPLASYLSAIVGYVGIVLLLWMYILGAKSVMSLLFHDLAPVVSIHKKLGKWGSVAVLVHPLLTTYYYGESLLYSLVPHIGTEFERHVTLGRIALWLMVVTAILSVYFRKRLGFRTWRYIHYLAYICVPFALLHAPAIGTRYMNSAAVKAYFFALVVIAIVFTVIRIRGVFNLDKHAYTVISNEKLSDVDYLLRLKPVSSQIRPRPGQYVYLKLGYISEDHPFSVTQYNESSGELFLTFRTFGMFTHVASQLTPERHVYVGGPFGSFTSEITPELPRVVYIAGGIGITPFVDRILRESTAREQWLFAANRSPETAVFVSTLRPYLNERCVEVYETAPETFGLRHETGYLSAAIIEKYLTFAKDCHYFVCGPPPMMAATGRILKEMGVPANQVHTEKFGW
ncbi:MAG: ferric reductase-like transmembrane domain-containing protein [Candidatus Saccharimonadales bacterium]